MFFILKAYVRDLRASVTIFALVVFAFLMSFGGLIFDVGRIFNLHSQAQAYVDEAALTAAAELDGEAGAIQRAIRAAVGDAQAGPIIDPGFRLTLSGDSGIGIQSLVFLEAIADDPAPNTRSPIAGDTVLCTYESGAVTCDGLTQAEADRRVNFVLVNATTETENFYLFPIMSAFVPGMRTEASVGPQALAGFTREICNFPPMAICNPQEDPGGGGGFSVNPGQQILLQTQGASAGWAPGDFGFLDLTGVGANGCSGGGGDFLRCLLATVNPNTSCVSADVDLNPGQVTSADVGFNVRFDLYDPPFQNDKNNANFPPAYNVTKGWVESGQCRLDKLDPPPVGAETVKLPRDPDVGVANRIGSGPALADLQSYWATNHNGAALPAGITTRYEAYIEEVSTSQIPDKSGLGGEDGNPSCSLIPPVANRRNMIVAVINCIEHSVSGSAKDVPVIVFLEMFLTEPAGDPGDNSNHDIYAEVVDTVQPGGSNGVLHEFPVLYR